MPLEVARDSACIVVRDWSIGMKDLVVGEDEELIQKYASSRYIEHLMNKQAAGSTPAEGQVSKTDDPLFAASSGNQYSYEPSKRARREEGVKIHVGAGYQQQEEAKPESDKKNDGGQA